MIAGRGDSSTGSELKAVAEACREASRTAEPFERSRSPGARKSRTPQLVSARSRPRYFSPSRTRPLSFIPLPLSFSESFRPYPLKLPTVLFRTDHEHDATSTALSPPRFTVFSRTRSGLFSFYKPAKSNKLRKILADRVRTPRQTAAPPRQGFVQEECRFFRAKRDRL
jgi:hypothetical protein